MYKRLLGLTGAVALGVSIAQSAQAGTLYNGWNYSIDAQNDGSGGSVYDIKGLAFRETDDHVYFSISGNTPLTGTSYSRAADGNIGWGDLMLNFSGNSFAEAEQNGDLFGIRFSETNDSGVTQLGLYSDITTTSVAGDNSGYTNLNKYYTTGSGKFNVDDTMGDLSTQSEVFEYLTGDANSTTVNTNNVIASGNYVGAIEMVSDQDAADQGLDFSNFNAAGNEQITFRLDRGLLPSASFIANVFLECANDGVALHGETADVPEPSAMGGLVLLGMIAGGRRLRKRRAIA